MSPLPSIPLVVDESSHSILTDILTKVAIPDLRISQLRMILALLPRIESVVSFPQTIKLTQSEVIFIKGVLDAVNSWHPSAAPRVVALYDVLDTILAGGTDVIPIPTNGSGA